MGMKKNCYGSSQIRCFNLSFDVRWSRYQLRLSTSHRRESAGMSFAKEGVESHMLTVNYSESMYME